MSNNYSICRKKAESADKLFIMKNNKPDAVLFSFAQYEMLSAIIEYAESSGEKDIEKVMGYLSKTGEEEAGSIENLKML
jgi:PHD/YefM family antitoxin component YafN of YafNO toxin-antitoxin module